MEKTQKDYVQDAIREHFYVLKSRNQLHKEIDAKLLRNNLIPKVKKQIKLSYNIGPTLFYKWADEVNSTEFENLFSIVHQSARKERSRVVYQNQPMPSTHENAYENMMMEEERNADFKFRDAVPLHQHQQHFDVTKELKFLQDETQKMTDEPITMVTSETIDQLSNISSSETVPKSLYMKLYNQFKSLKADYESDLQRWQSLREHQVKRMETMNDEIKRLRKEFHNYSENSMEHLERRLKRTKLEEPPSITRVSPNSGKVGEPLNIDFFIENFNVDGKWSCMVHDANMNITNSYPLNKDCIIEGNLALPLGTFRTTNALTIYFEDESLPEQHIYRRSKPIIVKVQENIMSSSSTTVVPQLNIDSMEYDMMSLSNLLDDELNASPVASSWVGTPMFMEDELQFDMKNDARPRVHHEKANRESRGREQHASASNSKQNNKTGSPFDGYRPSNSGKRQAQPRESRPSSTSTDAPHTNLVTPSAYNCEFDRRGGVTFAPSCGPRDGRGLGRRWVTSHRQPAVGRVRPTAVSHPVILRPIQFDERGNMVVQRGQPSFVWVDQTNEFGPSTPSGGMSSRRSATRVEPQQLHETQAPQQQNHTELVLNGGEQRFEDMVIAPDSTRQDHIFHHQTHVPMVAQPGAHLQQTNSIQNQFQESQTNRIQHQEGRIDESSVYGGIGTTFDRTQEGVRNQLGEEFDNRILENNPLHQQTQNDTIQSMSIQERSPNMGQNRSLEQEQQVSIDHVEVPNSTMQTNMQSTASMDEHQSGPSNVENSEIQFAERVALIVSPSMYDGLAPLDSIQKDADKISSVLQNYLGFNILRAGGQDKDSTLAAIEQIGQAKEFIFYFAGHGRPGHIVLGNSEILEYQELIEALPQSCERVLLLVDACYSGTISNVSLRHLPSRRQLTIHALSSSDPYQRSIEQKNAGLFTQAVCDAIGNHRCALTTDSILTEIEEVVQMKSLSLSGISQQPQLYKLVGDDELEIKQNEN